MAEGGSFIPSGARFPLNSKRLQFSKVKIIAENLGLPTRASSDELRQLVDGKLLEMGHQPSNVQVIVQEQVQKIFFMQLIDESGVIQKGEYCVKSYGEQIEKEMKEKDKVIDDLIHQKDELTSQLERRRRP